MKEIKPSYYEKFICTAGKCDFTCCQEWKIYVDDACMERWKSTPAPGEDGEMTSGKRGAMLSDYTTEKDESLVIRLNAAHRCPFLDREGLCRIVKACGEQMLSETCHVFPREVHTLTDRKEYVLLMSCPEAVRLLHAEGFHLTEKALPENEDLPEEENHRRDADGCAEKIIDFGEAEGKLYDDEEAVQEALLLALREKVFRIVKKSASAEEALLAAHCFLTEELLTAAEEALLTAECEAALADAEIEALLEEIRSLPQDREACFSECSALFMDLTENYAAENMYAEILQPLRRKAEKAALSREFLFIWSGSSDFMKDFIQEEIYAGTVLPGFDVTDLIVKLQWIMLEYILIRHFCYLNWLEKKKTF